MSLKRISTGITALAFAGGALAALTAPAPAAARPGDVIVSESFSGGALPAGWNAVSGTWTVQNGRLVGSAANGANNRITFGRKLNDFRFEADVRFESVVNTGRWAALGLDMPATGAAPWWIATMRTGSTASNGLEFAQRTASNTWNVTDTAAAPHAAGTGRDIRVSVEVHGTQARWSFDGTEVMRTSRLQRSVNGVQGLVVNGATVSFDNIRITELARNAYLRSAGGPVSVIAHRGASSSAPENTIAAQDAARRAGADFIENDVQPSSDGVPFVLHDSTVDRTTDGTGAVRNRTSAYLRTLDAGSWFSSAYAGEKMPTLAEQLTDLRTRGGRLLLEIKGSHTRAQVATVIDVVRAQQMASRVFVQSFDTAHLRYVRDLAPEIPLGLLRSTLDADPAAVAADLGLTAYNPSAAALLARPSAVAALHDADIAVMAWTSDSAAQWASLRAAGVDGIITNKPAELVAWND